ncbi:MAG: Wzz/FepE/Etk N-terminal domain-containing protein [Prevotella sp.]|nr:Wzz/FepE/Etk N-terminal domain-containing protein [Prevotella sp.]
MEKQKKKIEVDFFLLLSILKKERKRLGITCFVAAVIGVALAFCVPKIYKSSVMLAPEETDNSLLSNFSSLASMVGMNMKMNNSNDAIYPEIYPDLMQSTNFLTGLFDIKVTSKDGKINTTYSDYMKHQKFPFWDYPGVLMAKITKSFRKKDPKTDETKVDPFRLTKDQFDIMKGISNNIDCSVDKKTSVITITITDQDPLIAATVADSVKERLQLFITDYRTNKARNDLAYMEQLYEEAKSQYLEAQVAYSQFSDANQDLLLESVKSKQDYLENDMQLKYNIYTQVSQQLQMARAKVQERTPAFTEVQSATVPIKHSSTPKIVVLILFAFLAFVVYVAWLTYKNRNIIFSYSGLEQEI